MKLIATVLLSLTLSSQAFGAADGTYELDSRHSTAFFKIGHIGISKVVGRFNTISGSFKVAGSELLELHVSIDTSSIDTGVQRRDNHLRSPDFLNAAQYPTMTFDSSTIEKTAANTYKVSGTLNLHGVSKEITVTMAQIGEGNDPWGGYRLGAEGSFKLSRVDYSMTNLLDTAGNEIEISLVVEGVRQ